MIFRCSVATRILLSLLPLLAPRVGAQQEQPRQRPHNPCRLYLGPSSLSSDDFTKLGLFAGIDFDARDILPFPELAIPMIDLLDGPYSFIDEYKDILKGLESNVWTADFAGAAKFEGNYSTSLFVGGLGSLAQYHAAYANVDWVPASTMLNFEALQPPGKAHPTRGTISPYSNLTMRATQHIPAGMELFPAFGEVWDDDTAQQKDDMFEQRLIRSDYVKADELVGKLMNLLNHPDLAEDAELKEETLDLVLEKILPAAGGKRAKAIRSLIPAASRKLAGVQEVGTFKYRHSDAIRSAKWLKKNAVCVDTLRPGTSTIPEAGRGAFATRPFKKGERVTVSPLVPVYDDIFQMYGIERKQSGDAMWLEFNNDHLGQQLAMNYIFGHTDSPLSFFPTAPGVTLINHHSTKANVQMDWADHTTLFTNSDLYAKSVQELRAMDPQPFFIMQFVATRDINAGEEILMDYGPEWDETWNDYFSKNDWTEDWPLQAIDIQRQHITQPFPVNLRTLPQYPYPDGVMTACFLQTDEVEDGNPRITEQGYKIFRWTGPTSHDDYLGYQLTICDLMARSGDDSDVSTLQYTVHTRLAAAAGSNHDPNDIVQVTNVPHAAIVVVNRAYQSDVHTIGAYRRWISIRDEILPQAWRVRDVGTAAAAS